MGTSREGEGGYEGLVINYFIMTLFLFIHFHYNQLNYIYINRFDLDLSTNGPECCCGLERDLPLRGSRPGQQRDESLEQRNINNIHQWSGRLKCAGQIHSAGEKYFVYKERGAS